MARWRTHHKRAARNRWREVELAKAEMERLCQIVLEEVTRRLVHHAIRENFIEDANFESPHHGKWPDEEILDAEFIG